MDNKMDVPLDADKLLSGAGQPPHTGDGLAVIAEEFQDGTRGFCVCELIGINGEDNSTIPVVKYFCQTKLRTDPECLEAPWFRNPSEETKEIVDQSSVIVYFRTLTSSFHIPCSVQEKVTSSRFFSAVQLSSHTFANPTVCTRFRRSSHMLQFERATVGPHAPFTSDLDRTLALLLWSQLDSVTITPDASYESLNTPIERMWIDRERTMRLSSQMPESVRDEITESDGEDALHDPEVD
jgi:hypothetical protein